MSKINLREIEDRWDYSIALLDEVMEDIKKISHYSSTDIGNRLDNINNKIYLARWYWINVDSLDKQVLDFRIVLFKRDVNNMIENVTTQTNKYEFDINKIELEYEELLKEQNVDIEYISSLIKKLKDELIKAKILFMIRHLAEWENNSAFTFDRIAHEISEAKAKWINVDDIEEILFS